MRQTGLLSREPSFRLFVPGGVLAHDAPASVTSERTTQRPPRTTRTTRPPLRRPPRRTRPETWGTSARLAGTACRCGGHGGTLPRPRPPGGFRCTQWARGSGTLHRAFERERTDRRGKHRTGPRQQRGVPGITAPKSSRRRIPVATPPPLALSDVRCSCRGCAAATHDHTARSRERRRILFDRQSVRDVGRRFLFGVPGCPPHLDVRCQR